MIEIFFSNYLTFIYIYISGLVSLNFLFNKKKYNSFEIFFLGFVSLSFISLLINFFTPLSKLINSITALAIIFLFLFNFKKNFTKKLFYLSIIISFTSTILLYKSNIFRPDAGLYHIPFIKILNEEKIIF